MGNILTKKKGLICELSATLEYNNEFLFFNLQDNVLNHLIKSSLAMLIECGPLPEAGLNVEPLETEASDPHLVEKREAGCGKEPNPECCYGSCG